MSYTERDVQFWHMNKSPAFQARRHKAVTFIINVSFFFFQYFHLKISVSTVSAFVQAESRQRSCGQTGTALPTITCHGYQIQRQGERLARQSVEVSDKYKCFTVQFKTVLWLFKKVPALLKGMTRRHDTSSSYVVQRGKTWKGLFSFSSGFTKTELYTTASTLSSVKLLTNVDAIIYNLQEVGQAQLTWRTFFFLNRENTKIGSHYITVSFKSSAGK